MPFAMLRLKPGVQIEATPTQNQAGYSLSQLGRFKAGLFQKLGGWTKYFATAVSGIPRALLAWQDLNQTGRLAVATTTQLGVITSGALSNISPQTYTTNSAVNFTTVINTPTVTIVDAGLTASLTTFDLVNIVTPVSVGGLILVGLYPVQTILSTTSYTITAASNATASVSNAGAVSSFTTTNGSSTVTVTLNGHGLSVSKTFVVTVATTVGGITFAVGAYTVNSITDANNFTVTATTQASSGTTGSMNSGNAQFIYGITLGPIGSGTAYGFGLYGAGLYGGTGSSGSVQTGSAIAVTSWTLDNWGQDLIACPQGGQIYYWNPSAGLTNATPIPNGPLYNSGIFISARLQFVIAYGSTPVPNGIGYQQDPLFVKWCSQGDFLTWTPSATNQAGGQRLSSGSRIIAGYAGPLNDYLWTDLDMWSMNYLNFPDVFGFNKIGDNCGIVGPHAFASLASDLFWMGQTNFFTLSSGGVSVLPCTVWDAVFQDLDTANSSKCWTWSSTTFDEIWFFYPSLSGGIGECDKYVKFCKTEQTWDLGPLQRSAGIDQSVLGNPIAATRTGIIYLHETGYDGDGVALTPLMQTGYFEIGEGEDYSFVDRIIPDMKWGTYAGAQTASVQITILATNYPGDTPTAYGPYTVTQATEYVPVRIRARQLAVQVQSSDAGSFWRLGGIRYRYAPDGRR